MTQQHTCARCGRPIPDAGTVCRVCTAQAHDTLTAVGPLLDELERTAHRLDRVTTTGGSYRPAPADDDDTAGVRLPWNGHAAACETTLRKACADAARLLDPHGWPWSPARRRQPWTWLADHLDDLRLTEWAPDALDAIDAASRRGWEAIDRPEQRYYAGPCGASTHRSDDGTETTCTVVLWAALDAPQITCPRCRTPWDVTARRNWLVRSARDLLAPVADIASVVTLMTRTRLTASTIRTWRHRHPARLPVLGVDDRGRQLHRVGDVLDLIEHPPTTYRLDACGLPLAVQFTAAATVTRGPTTP